MVAYTVVVAIGDTSEQLLPYLTANLQFEVERRENVLLVPSDALRWRPAPQWIAPEVQEKTSSSSQKRDGRVWVQDGKFVRPIAVQVGLGDSSQTEISGGNVREGMEVVVGEKADEAINPFAPKIFKGGGERR